MDELSIPEHLKKKGITLMNGKPYGIIMMKGKRFLFDIFESWGDTQKSLHECLGDLDGDRETRYDIMLLLMLEHQKRGKLRWWKWRRRRGYQLIDILLRRLPALYRRQSLSLILLHLVNIQLERPASTLIVERRKSIIVTSDTAAKANRNVASVIHLVHFSYLKYSIPKRFLFMC